MEGLYDRKFVEAGGTLPADKDPSREYTGEKFITCIPLLTQVKRGENLKIKALIMGEVSSAILYYRSMGADTFTSIPMNHEARGVYRAVVPGQQDDFEWYVTAETSLGDVVFPATAGAWDEERMFQSVVIAGKN